MIPEVFPAMVHAVFPVVSKDEHFVPLDVSARYVIAANGIFLEQRTPFFAAAVRVDRVAGMRVEGLEPHAEWLELALPPLDSDYVAQAVSFFRTVYQRWGGEAILLLFRERPEGERPARWALDAPPQLMSGQWHADGFHAAMRLAYGSCDKPGPAYVRAGSIHSHGAGAAYHSDTDVQDEVGGAGLHITVGRVDAALPEFAASFVVGETRFTVPVEDVLAPLEAPRDPPPHWLPRVAPATGHVRPALPAGGVPRCA